MYGYQLHIFLEHKIRRQTVFLETLMRLLSRNWALICFKNFKYVWKTNIRPFSLLHKLPNSYLYIFVTKPQSPSNWPFFNQMEHWTLLYFPPFSLLGKVKAKVYKDKTKAIVVIPKWSTQHWYPNFLRKAMKSMTITPSAENLLQSHDSQKVHPLHQKASPTSTPNWWTTQDIINESLCKSKCKKYLYYQECWKEYCAEKNIVYDSPAVEQFLTFLTELLYQGVSDSVLISAKSAVAHVLKMKYQHISQQPSVIKYLKGWFNLRTPLRNISFVWDV